ncbi:MAG: hypothetical protein CSA05_01875 [Bacteroidia bacterium]|nr:MAG: hypothetical protein CSA05_01875 [Bacteroidia bacterium]
MRYFFIILSLISCVFFTKAQQLTPVLYAVASATANSNGNSMAISVGQVFACGKKNSKLQYFVGYQEQNNMFFKTRREEKKRFKIKIYPNPTKDFVKIQTKGEEKIIKYEIYNLSGQMLKAEETNFMLETNYLSLDIRSYKPGHYFVKCYFKNRINNTTLKIVKL